MDTDYVDFGDSPYYGKAGDVVGQAKALQDYLDGKKGSYDPKQGVPVGYKIDNGKVVKEGQWDQWGKDATEFFGSAVPTILTAGMGMSIPGLGMGSGGASAAAQGGKMGILDTIGRISNLATPLADVLGGASKAGQAQNNTDNLLRLNLNNDKLAAKKFATTAPDARMKTALTALLSKYAKPAQVQWGGPGSGLRGEVPTYTGGAKSIFDAAKDPQYQKLAGRVTEDSLLAQMNGGASGGNQDVATSEIQPNSKFDDVLGGAGFGSSILAALGKFKALKPSPSTPAIPDGV